MNIPEDIANQAKLDFRLNKALVKSLKRKVPPDLDETIARLHEQVFAKTDCLECGNCCRALGPRVRDKDIERLSRFLKMKPSLFTETHLRMDEDHDYIFRMMPCPFLQDDNYCSVYSQRPLACREYPHTDRNRFHQVLDLTLKNSFTCPAVLAILRKLREVYGR